MSEISQEAKNALAEISKRKAREHLHRDGSDSTPVMQRRIQALAAERSIPPADFAKLLHKRVGMNAVAAFCEKHNDWLLCGDLQGLQRMAREAKAAPPEMSEAQRKEVTRLFLALSPL